MASISPFDFLNAINHTKENLFDDPQANKDYSPFMINRGLSYFPDTILHANEMNRYSKLDSKMQFDYLLNSIAKRKRFSKWVKKGKAAEALKLVMSYYGYSEAKAEEVMDILTKEQLNIIKEKQQKGGRK